MSSLKRLASQTAVYGLSSILGRLVNWLLTPLFVNVLVQAEYGVLSDLYALTFYPLILLTFGQETAFFRWNSDGTTRPEDSYAAAMRLVLLLTGGFAAVWVLFAGRIASGLGYADRPELLYYVLAIILLDVVSALPLAHLRYREQAMKFAVISLSNIGVFVLLNAFFLLVLDWRSVEAILLANLLASALKCGLACWRNLPPSLRAPAQLQKTMRDYGFFIMIAGLAGALNETVDRNLLPRLWPAEGAEWAATWRTGFEMNAIYAAVYKLGMLISLATQAFRYAAEPFFFRAAGNQQSPALFAKVFHYYALVTLAMFVLVAAFRTEIAGFNGFGLLSFHLLPPDYWIGLQAVPLLLAANVCLGFYLNFSIWFKLTGQVRFALLYTFVGAAITLTINLIFIPKYGYMASAWATLLCYGTMAWLCYKTGQRYYPIPYNLRKLAFYAGLSMVVFAICSWLDGPGYAPPSAGVSIGKLVLVGLVFGWVFRLERKQFRTRTP